MDPREDMQRKTWGKRISKTTKIKKKKIKKKRNPKVRIIPLITQINNNNKKIRTLLLES